MMVLALLSAVQTTMLDVYDAALGWLCALLVATAFVLLALAWRGAR